MGITGCLASMHRHHASHSESEDDPELSELTDTLPVECLRGGIYQRPWATGAAGAIVASLDAACLRGEDIFGVDLFDALFLDFDCPVEFFAAAEGRPRAPRPFVGEEDAAAADEPFFAVC